MDQTLAERTFGEQGTKSQPGAYCELNIHYSELHFSASTAHISSPRGPVLPPSRYQLHHTSMSHRRSEQEEPVPLRTLLLQGDLICDKHTSNTGTSQGRKNTAEKS